MKIAVVGGGSTYTPELVDGLGRMRDVLPVEELVLVDPAADRLELVGGVRPADPRPAGPPGHADHHDRPGAGARRRRRRAAAAAGRRPGRAAPGRDLAAGVRLRRPGDHRRRRSRQGAADGAGRPRHRRAGADGRTRTPGSSTSPTRSASSPGPCSRPVTGRSGCATSRSASSAASPDCLGVEPERVQLDHVGLNHLTWERAVRVDGVDRLPELLAAHVDDLAERHRAAGRACCTQLGVVPSYYLRYFYAHDEVVARAAAQPSRAPRRSTAIERELLAHVRRPDARREAGAARAARRRVLLRGGGPAGRGAARAAADRRRPRSSTCATTAPCRSSPTTRSSRCPPRSTAPACARCRSRRWRRCTPDSSPHVTAYEHLALEAAAPRRLRAGLPGPAGASPRRPGRPRRRARPTGWSPTTATTCRGPEMSETGRPARRPRRSTPATARPTSRWSRPTAGWSAPRAADRSCPTGSAPRRPWPGWPRSSRAACADAGLAPGDAGRSCSTSPPASPTPTCPPSRRRSSSAVAAHGLGRLERGLQRHLRRAARRRSTSRAAIAVVCGAGINCAGLLPGRPHRALRRGRAHLRRLGRRWAPLAGGDVVGGARRGRPRTGHRAPRRRCPATSASTTMAELIEAVHLGAITEARCLELTPVLFEVAADGDATAAGRRTTAGRGGRRARRRGDAAPRRPRRADRRGARRRRASRPVTPC